MNTFISQLFAWAGNVFVLSALLSGFYFALSRFHIKSNSRYFFLKILLLTLPFLPWVVESLHLFLAGFFQSPQMSVPQTVWQDHLKAISTYQTTSNSQTIFGWLVFILVLLYGLSLLRGAFGLLRSALQLRRIKQSAVPLTTINQRNVLIHDFNIPPAATGLVRPVILIPRKILEVLSASELDLIIEHESIHIKRLDPLVNLFRLLLREILIFSPFALYLVRSLEEEMELSVDELLMLKHSEIKREYGGLLLRLCVQDGEPVGLLCSGLFKSKSFISRRIHAMKTVTQLRSKPIMVGSIIISFLALGVITIPALGLDDKSKVKIPVAQPLTAVDSNYCSQSSCSPEFVATLKDAERGNADAQNKVGEMLHFGDGVAQNYSEARNWYLRASKQDHAEAANHLGRIYNNGEGVAKDDTVACKWYVTSGERGLPWGMMNAAFCYRHGHGLPKDRAKAEEWYQRAEKAKPGILKEYAKINPDEQD